MHGSAPPIETRRDTAPPRRIHSSASASNGTGSADEAPLVRLDHLDTLWFQVTGTICNLRCVTAVAYRTTGPTVDMDTHLRVGIDCPARATRLRETGCGRCRG